MRVRLVSCPDTLHSKAMVWNCFHGPRPADLCFHSLRLCYLVYKRSRHRIRAHLSMFFFCLFLRNPCAGLYSRIFRLLFAGLLAGLIELIAKFTNLNLLDRKSLMLIDPNKFPFESSAWFVLIFLLFV